MSGVPATDNTNTLDSAQKEELSIMLQHLRKFFGDAHDMASVGLELHDLDIPNEFTDGVKQAIETPIQSGYEAFQYVKTSLMQQISNEFEKFLSTKMELIDRVFLVSKNQLHYVIILKENNITNRVEILDFKMDYDEKPVSKSFPLIVTFTKLEHLKGAKITREVTFEEPKT